MKSLIQCISLICLCPSLVVADSEIPAGSVLKALTAAISAEAVPAPMESYETSGGRIYYRVGSDDESLTAVFPSRAQGRLMGVPGEQFQMVLFLDLPNPAEETELTFFAVGSSEIGPEEYDTTREDWLKNSDLSIPGLDLDAVSIVEKEGIIRRSQTMHITLPQENGPKFTAKMEIILTHHYLFYLIVAGNGVDPLSNEAREFLCDWRLNPGS